MERREINIGKLPITRASSPPPQRENDNNLEEDLQSKKGKNTRHKWSEFQVSYLIHLLKKYKKSQPGIQNAFSKEAWTQITNDFNIKFATEGVKMTKDQLREKEQTMKKNFKAYKTLIEKSGFGWDSQDNYVIAHPGYWNDLMKDTSNASRALYKLKGKRFPYYNDCFELYDGRYAEGKKSRGPEDYVVVDEVEEECESLTPNASLLAPGDNTNDDDNNDEYWNEYQYNSEIPATQVPPAPASIIPPAPASEDRRSSKKRGVKEMWRSEYFERKKEETEKIINATLEVPRLKAEYQLANMERQREIDLKFSTKTCIQAYEKLQGFNEEDDEKAHSFFEKSYNREFFLSISEHKRESWLRMMFRNMN